MIDSKSPIMTRTKITPWTWNASRELAAQLVADKQLTNLEIAHRAYLLELGRVLREGPAAEIAADHSLLDAYLGRGQAAQRAAPAQLTT